MSDRDRDYLAIIQQDAERFRLAGLQALAELKPECFRCWTLEQIQAWSERVNARALEILARPN